MWNQGDSDKTQVISKNLGIERDGILLPSCPVMTKIEGCVLCIALLHLGEPILHGRVLVCHLN
jgi:hypothetical protein